MNGIISNFLLICLITFLNGCQESKSEINESLSNDAMLKPQSDSDEMFIIKPGVGIGKIQIGKSKEETLAIVQQNSLFIFDMVDYRDSENYQSQIIIRDTNRNMETVGNGIRIVIKDSKVFQIRLDSITLRTATGLTTESLLTDVKTNYPNGAQYKLEGSWQSNLTGPKDLIYWVDESAGIAFEFYYNTKEKRRRISNIYIMQPGTSFRPFGGDIAPKFTKWIKM